MTRPPANTLDDLDAVRTIVGALKKFPTADQQRILRWAQEKIGLAGSSPTADQPPAAHSQYPVDPPASPTPASHPTNPPSDIKTFILTKTPNSDTQFAAAVAYYHRFEAPTSARKDTIAADDLHDACRKVGRNRMTRPAQTLLNAHAQGLLDKSGERGHYTLSTVGENLVAVALPAPSETSISRAPKKRAGKRKQSRAKKSRR